MKRGALSKPVWHGTCTPGSGFSNNNSVTHWRTLQLPKGPRFTLSSRYLSEWNTALQKNLVSSMSSLAKEQRAGSQVLSFLSPPLQYSQHRLLWAACWRNPSGSFFGYKLSELQWALERALSKQNLMRQSTFSWLLIFPSRKGVDGGLLFFHLPDEENRDLESLREISIWWHFQKVAESGPPSHIG